MKVYKDDGTFYYYYYKKKKGRKKKRGPKTKKKNKKVKLYDGSWNFKIIQFDFKKQVRYIGKYRTLADVEKKKRELISENEKVEFPVEYINNRRKSESMYYFESEYVVLKKIKPDENRTTESKVQNEYGKFVTHVTTSKNYYVYEKFKKLTEETFWVYGYNPRIDRKTYRFIRERFVEELPYERDSLLNIYLYNNKVIFKYDDDFEFVICKNMSDALRMYKMLLERYGKTKGIIFTGRISGASERVRYTIDMMKEKTGWPLAKIYKTNTYK